MKINNKKIELSVSSVVPLLCRFASQGKETVSGVHKRDHE